MKTSLEIINKLSEKEAVKLDSQLVELALIDDLRKQANTSSKLNAENINLINKVKSNYKESLSILSKVETEAQRALKLAIELGVGDSIYKDFLSSVKQDISINQKLLDKHS
jgi:hypothetical protein